MIEHAFKYVVERFGSDIALLLFGFVIGVVYMLRHCKATQRACHQIRTENKDEILGKIDKVKEKSEEKAKGSREETESLIKSHIPGCPNTVAIAELRATYNTEVQNIHYRLTEVQEVSKQTRAEVKKELCSVKDGVSKEMSDQKKFLSDLAQKIMSSNSKAGGTEDEGQAIQES